jgi:3-hydroxyisobutyrate dehydrogenase
VDAPVSGGDVGARNATLSIMVGGDADAVTTVRPLFERSARTSSIRAPGAGLLKMCTQIVIAGTMIGVCEPCLWREGRSIWRRCCRRSRAGRLAADPGETSRALLAKFRSDSSSSAIKDMGIALAEARRMNLSLPGLALVQQLYIAVQAQGHGRKGTHALVLALEHLSGI